MFDLLKEDHPSCGRLTNMFLSVPFLTFPLSAPGVHYMQALSSTGSSQFCWQLPRAQQSRDSPTHLTIMFSPPQMRSTEQELLFQSVSEQFVFVYINHKFQQPAMTAKCILRTGVREKQLRGS